MLDSDLQCPTVPEANGYLAQFVVQVHRNNQNVSSNLMFAASYSQSTCLKSSRKTHRNLY